MFDEDNIVFLAEVWSCVVKNENDSIYNHRDIADVKCEYL